MVNFVIHLSLALMCLLTLLFTSLFVTIQVGYTADALADKNGHTGLAEWLRVREWNSNTLKHKL